MGNETQKKENHDNHDNHGINNTYLFFASSHLKQIRKRWIVLKWKYLYLYKQKYQYENETEKFDLSIYNEIKIINDKNNNNQFKFKL